MKNLFNNPVAHSKTASAFANSIVTACEKVLCWKVSKVEWRPAQLTQRKKKSVLKAKLNELPHLGMRKGCDIYLQNLVLETRSARQEKSHLLKYPLCAEDLQGKCNHWVMFTWLVEREKGKTKHLLSPQVGPKTVLCCFHFIWLNLDNVPIRHYSHF